jgi:hypothetical protein
MTLRPWLRDNSVNGPREVDAPQYYAHMSAERPFTNWAVSFLRNENDSAIHTVLANEVTLLTSLATAYVVILAA